MQTVGKMALIYVISVYLLLIKAVISFEDVTSVRDTFTDLDDNNVLHIDNLVRRRLLFMILDRLNQTIEQQNSISGECEVKINSSMTTCQNCFQSQCSSGVPLNVTSVMNQLLLTVYEPVLTVGHFVGGISSSIGSIPTILGTDHGLFYQTLGQLATTVGSGLDQGTSTLLSGAGNVYSTLGKGLDSISSHLIAMAGNSLEHIAGSTGNLLHTIGQSGSSILTQAGSGLGGVVSGLQHSVQQLGAGIDSAGHSLLTGAGNILSGAVQGASGLLSLFGRRAALEETCTARCSDCGTFDTKIHNNVDIIKTVCGQKEFEEQQSALNLISRLRNLYNTTLTTTIISHVDYDATSMHTSGGISFSNAYVTALTDTGFRRIKLNGDLILTGLPTVANALADQIWRQWN